MKKTFTLGIFMIVVALQSYAQMSMDTLYYDNNWQVVDPKMSFFAEYYRIYATSPDTVYSKPFRTFYMGGNLQAEGKYFYLDSINDRNSIFDGEIKSYYKDGKTATIAQYVNKKQDGEYIEFAENGEVKKRCFYKDGLLDGKHTEIMSDGIHEIEVRFENGNVIRDTYIIRNLNVSNSDVIVDFSTNLPKFETPQIEEQKFIRSSSGDVWCCYEKNGLWMGVAFQKENILFKNYIVSIFITNNSPFNIELNTEEITAFESESLNERKVYSAEGYRKKANSIMVAAAVMTGIAGGLASATAGVSTVNVTTSNGYTASARIYDSNAALMQTQHYARAAASLDQTSIDIQNSIKREYIQNVVLQPGQTVSGYFVVNRVNGLNTQNYMEIHLPLAGVDYVFSGYVGRLGLTTQN